jgi:hypothetical protein
VQTWQPEAIQVWIFAGILLPREGPITKATGGVEFTGSQGSVDAEMVSAHGPHIAGPIIKYDDTFFDWLQPQMLMVDDYAYVGLDLRGDTDLALPEDAQWGDLGKKYTHFLFLNVFEFFLIIFKCFCFICSSKD